MHIDKGIPIPANPRVKERIPCMAFHLSVSVAPWGRLAPIMER